MFLGGVGIGKTHLASALGYAACLIGHSVLFATAIDVINTLAAAQAAGRIKQELKKYIRAALLICDEPIDKAGQTSCSRSSASAMSKALSLLLQTVPLNIGRKSSTTTAPSLPPSLTGFYITPKPS